ncbi:MAG: FeoA domain-containing protein [Armatimonadetes bacterium]|nr:FeoA domain-containing protein [Armatimonadota bacterium]MDW8121330.1 metal-dependent transcriptional regulator [Armatimonadota bacterium]
MAPITETEHLTREQEHCLELIWIQQHEKAHPPYLNQLTPSLTAETTASLEQQGFIWNDSGAWRLSAKGQEVARKILRRRRLAERLLADLLQTSGSILDEAACSMEHFLHADLEEAVCTLLGHPRFCPHGGEIPQGRCCEEARQSGTRLIVPLSEMKVGETGVIAYLQSKDPGQMQKLMAMGVLPGEAIKLIRRFPSFVFEVGLTQYAVDDAIADHIYIRLSPPSRDLSR